MDTITEQGAAYRTKCLTFEHAQQFASCLRSNDLFDQVLVVESDRAKGERRWYVVYSPNTEAGQRALLERQQETRTAKGRSEGQEYLFVQDPDGGRVFWCQALSGEVYEVTLLSCSCPDHEHRAGPAGLRCKHCVALEAAIQRGSVYGP